MRLLFIFLLALITLQVNAQKIIGSTTTAGGDLEGVYPNPRIKQNIINRANLTQGLRDSLTRFRHDTIIKVNTDGQTSLISIVNTLGRYNRVNIIVLGETGWAQSVVLPFAADTIRNTLFNVTHYSEDTTATCQLASFDGFMLAYSPPSIVSDLYLINIAHGYTVEVKPVYLDATWYWTSKVSKDIFRNLVEGNTDAGITALTGEVTASGVGSVAATITAGAVTTTKIADANVTLAKLATNSVNSSKIVDASVALADMASNSVDNTKIVDYSITGTDLNYLTLRAGDASNAILRFSNGADKTTVAGGEWLFDGNRLGFAISSTKKRLPLFNDAAPTGGQLMVGNGTDFTLANLTAGYAQTVTNGSGSITINPDTTKVIPYMSNAEIANGTRNGHYWNRTTGRFGHQFYRNGFTALHDFNIGTSAYLTDYLYMTGAGVSLTKNIVFGNPTLQIGVADNNRSTAITAYPMGLVTGAFYNNVETLTAASPGSTVAITGDYSTTYVTDSDISTLTLPNIIGTTVPTVDEVAIGYTVTIIINSATTVTITPNASDTFITNGSAGTSASITATTGATRIIELVAVGVNTWARKL